MDIDGDEGFSTRGPSKKREYESDESSQSSKSSDQPEKGKSSKKIRLGGAVKLILRTNTPAKSKGKIIASLSSSTSNLSSAPESEELQDPFTNNEEENEGNVRSTLWFLARSCADHSLDPSQEQAYQTTRRPSH